MVNYCSESTVHSGHFHVSKCHCIHSLGQHGSDSSLLLLLLCEFRKKKYAEILAKTVDEPPHKFLYALGLHW